MSQNIKGSIIDVKHLLQDEAFLWLMNDLYELTTTSDVDVMTENLMKITKHLKRMFAINTSISIIDQSDRGFFGVSIYPSYNKIDKIISKVLSNTMDSVVDEWQDNDEEWIIEIDSKLISNNNYSFNRYELAILFLYRIDQVVFNYKLPVQVAELIRTTLTDLDYRNNAVAKSSVCRDLYILPFMIASGFVNYKQNVPEESIIFNAGMEVINIYQEAWTKLLTNFGMLEHLNRQDEEMINTIKYSLNWIVEAINDMKYSTRTLRFNLQKFTTAVDSNYIKQILKKIFVKFTKVDKRVAALESTLGTTPKLEAVKEKMLDSQWQQTYQSITESEELVGEFIDNRGFVKKVDNKEIDIIALQLENIESVDDKIYLIERVYKFLSIVEYSLSLLDDDRMAKRVRVSRTMLERQRDELESLRHRIKSVKVSPKKYGIYIKYPVGYEG